MQRLWGKTIEIESESERPGTTNIELLESDKERSKWIELERGGSTGNIGSKETIGKWEIGNINGKIDRKEKDR